MYRFCLSSVYALFLRQYLYFTMNPKEGGTAMKYLLVLLLAVFLFSACTTVDGKKFDSKEASLVMKSTYIPCGQNASDQD